MEQTKLYLKNYNIVNVALSLNPSFKTTSDLIEMNPMFGKKVVSIDNSHVAVVLKVEIKNEGNKPFFGEITIQGNFRCDNWEKSEDGIFLVNQTTATILFPYLRHALSDVTSLMNIPPYILPVVNVQALFKDSK